MLSEEGLFLKNYGAFVRTAASAMVVARRRKASAGKLQFA